MIQKFFFIVFIFILILSCDNFEEGNSNSQMEKSKQDSAVLKDSTSENKQITTNNSSVAPYTKITPQVVIKVLTADKMFDTASKFYKVYKEKCSGWTLNKKNIEKIILGSKKIDGHAFHYYYEILPCFYSGEVSINGKSAQYKMNAGASTTIILKDSSIYLGYDKKDYMKFFLVGPGID